MDLQPGICKGLGTEVCTPLPRALQENPRSTQIPNPLPSLSHSLFIGQEPMTKGLKNPTRQQNSVPVGNYWIEYPTCTSSHLWFPDEEAILATLPEFTILWRNGYYVHVLTRTHTHTIIRGRIGMPWRATKKMFSELRRIKNILWGDWKIPYRLVCFLLFKEGNWQR